MAAGRSARTLRGPGRLIVNPTDSDLSGTYPYGGTEVGKTRGVTWAPLGQYFRVECEATGEASDILEPNQRWIFSCFMRGWDDDAVRLMLARGYTEDTVSQHAALSAPADVLPGQSAMSRAVVLVYVPEEPTRTPGLVLYSAIPLWTNAAEQAYQDGSELGIPLVMECMREDGLGIFWQGILKGAPL